MNNHTPAAEVLRCESVGKTFMQGEMRVAALRDINLNLAAGEQLCVIGASGSGKSTLLHILGGLDAPSTGQIWLDGQNLAELNARAVGRLRNRALGFVYQFHHLLMEFTALENVAMPLLIARRPRAESYARAAEMLTRVGLTRRASHKPGELSGGERQRAALARALVGAPKCLLADEPTGNLDTKTARAMHDLMLELNQELRIGLVVATHDTELARTMSRTIELQDGAIKN